MLGEYGVLQKTDSRKQKKFNQWHTLDEFSAIVSADV
jgi:hypothetical protein